MRHAAIAASLPAILLGAALLGGCAATLPPARSTNSALDFLYPGGIEAAQPATAVTLRLPLRVGLAFAPGRRAQLEPVAEEQKRVLLERVAAAFRDRPAFAEIEVVPSSWLQEGGGFANLDQLRVALGLDTMVLLSYDQVQFTDATRASWTYLTVVGALLIEGEKNETRTVVDAVVYDLPSRALLLRSAGESAVRARSGPFTVTRTRRELAAEGFSKATDALIGDLDRALAAFETQARTGTVQGPGTPAVTLLDATGQPLGPGSAGAGALGPWDLAAVLALLGLAAACRGRRRARRSDRAVVAASRTPATTTEKRR